MRLWDFVLSFRTHVFFQGFDVPLDEIAAGSPPAFSAGKVISRVDRSAPAAGVLLPDARDPLEGFEPSGLVEVFPEVEPMGKGHLEIREGLAGEIPAFAAKV